MRILLASSEVFPYSKTGGLADMTGALAKYLAAAGHEVALVTPLYHTVRHKVAQFESKSASVTLPLGPNFVKAEILTLQLDEEGLTVYFVDQPEFYDRPGLYGQGGQDYPDNAERFIFFSKCVTYLARYLPWKPQIVHLHDWQTAMAPLFIDHQKWQEGWINPPRTCLTIHNLAYQGVFPASKYPLTNLPWQYFGPKGVEFYGNLNSLKAGLVYSDLLTTVSPRYAEEITTEEFGCGLEGVLLDRQKSLVGILNGVDYMEWKTTGNPYLKHSYDAQNLAAKTAAKLDLQAELHLPPRADVPLFGTVSRLVDQKGMDIMLGALEEMLSADLQFALLGSGEPRFEKAFSELAARRPEKVAVRLGYDHGLSHRIEAGCDFFLMPSRFEPCGLNQMYSLRYGTIPIVRATGGLDDSVTGPAEGLEEADGIKFEEYSARALAKAIRKAIVLFQHPAALQHFRENAMAADFSWTRTTAEYLRLFESLLS
jgi:starch synthase